MEKYTPSFNLDEIKNAFLDFRHLNLTRTAWRTVRELGFRRKEIVEVVQSLERKSFYKSMTSYKDYKIWQDVYRTEFDGIRLYVKFTINDEGYLVISFKEL